MKPMIACSTRPRIFQYIDRQFDVKRWTRRKAHHCVLGAKVVDYEGTADSPGHIEQTAEKLACGSTECGDLAAYLITVAQPNTTLREVLLPMMLQQD